MGRNDTIPVPAESLRRLAEGATAEIRDARQSGRKSTARSLQRDVAEALEAAAGKDGEYASVSASAVSSLAAAGVGGPAEVPEVWKHCDAAKVYLNQYGVW